MNNEYVKLRVPQPRLKSVLKIVLLIIKLQWLKKLNALELSMKILTRLPLSVIVYVYQYYCKVLTVNS